MVATVFGGTCGGSVGGWWDLWWLLLGGGFLVGGWVYVVSLWYAWWVFGGCRIGGGFLVGDCGLWMAGLWWLLYGR